MNYWGYREEQLVSLWLVAQTPKEQFKIHWQLEGKMLHMARQILFRYYSRTDPYLVQDACDYAFMGLLNNFNPDKGIKAYSYCQTIIKNHYHDTLVKDSRYTEHSIDEYDMSDEILIIHDQTMQDCQDIEQRILRRFKQLYAKDEARLQSALKTGSTITINDVRTYLPFIKYCIEYIKRFGAIGTLNTICEYVNTKMKLTDIQFNKCSIHVFEYSYNPNKIKGVEKFKERNGKYKKDVESPMLAFLNDDIVASEYTLKAGRKQKRKKQSIYNDDNN